MQVAITSCKTRVERFVEFLPSILIFSSSLLPYFSFHENFMFIPYFFISIAVYDLGGGTFDISVLEIQKGVFEVCVSIYGIFCQTHWNTVR